MSKILIFKGFQAFNFSFLNIDIYGNTTFLFLAIDLKALRYVRLNQRPNTVVCQLIFPEEIPRILFELRCS